MRALDTRLLRVLYYLINMEKICGIYKITNPSKKIYIGQSIDIYKRWNDYKILRCKTQQRLYKSFNKYGIKKHNFEIIHVCNREELNKYEKYYVDLFQTFNNKIRAIKLNYF